MSLAPRRPAKLCRAGRGTLSPKVKSVTRPCRKCRPSLGFAGRCARKAWSVRRCHSHSSTATDSSTRMEALTVSSPESSTLTPQKSPWCQTLAQSALTTMGHDLEGGPLKSDGQSEQVEPAKHSLAQDAAAMEIDSEEGTLKSESRIEQAGGEMHASGSPKPPCAAAKLGPLLRKVMAESDGREVEAKDARGELSVALGVVVSRMMAMTAEPENPSRFHASSVPPISIHAYVDRIQAYFRCSETCFVLALIYVDRLTRCRHDAVSLRSAHRVVIVAVTLAAKFYDDDFYGNDFYAKVGGLRLQEFNSLELELVKVLGWNLNVQPDEYTLYNSLAKRVARSGV